MPILYIAPAPQLPREWFYATNNPYQVSGPKGFTEFKYMEETHDLYVRLDFPGITKESVLILLEPSRKAVVVIGNTPKESKHDSSHRKYGTATGLICDCCVISNIQCFVGDGVVRLILSKKEINLHVPTFCSFGGARMPTDVPANIIRGYNPEVTGGHPLAHLRGLNPEGCRGTDPFDPAFMGPTILPHPSVLEGSTSAYESKQLSNGGLFLRIDMPGVPRDSFMVAVDGDDVVNVIGRAPATMHDSSGRNYVGKVAIVPRGYDPHRIKIIAKLGVIRLIIPPY
ncbi:PREDICTED: putative 57 kDa heat shock protein [Camelina sativa]|uniref:57 kDa heat shock protein n=1 Tax=Camelina sativa TaxID=90675 RepID=A0ABM1QMR1_CAMSA|nr:PREDICTED: putative 57 kDa heat shock protein [Camelina sativa]